MNTQRKLINGVDPFAIVYKTVSEAVAKSRKEKTESRFFLDKFGQLWSRFNKNEKSLICTSCGCRDCLYLSWFEIETGKQRQIGQAINRMRSFIEASNIVGVK